MSRALKRARAEATRSGSEIPSAGGGVKCAVAAKGHIDPSWEAGSCFAGCGPGIGIGMRIPVIIGHGMKMECRACPLLGIQPTGTNARSRSAIAAT